MGSELTLPISRWCSSCKAENENGKAQQQGRPVGSPPESARIPGQPQQTCLGVLIHTRAWVTNPQCALHSDFAVEAASIQCMSRGKPKEIY